MSSQGKVKKDKEIIAEYETQVKGRYRAGPCSYCYSQCVCVCLNALLRNLTTLLYMALSVQG